MRKGQSDNIFEIDVLVKMDILNLCASEDCAVLGEKYCSQDKYKNTNYQEYSNLHFLKWTFGINHPSKIHILLLNVFRIKPLFTVIFVNLIL